MAISVRERTGELAVLKTVGFTDLGVVLLILGEALLIALQGGLLGVLLAKGAAPGLANALPGFTFYLSPLQLASGVGLAVLVGLLAGAVPALSAMRLRVVDALRRV